MNLPPPADRLTLENVVVGVPGTDRDVSVGADGAAAAAAVLFVSMGGGSSDCSVGMPFAEQPPARAARARPTAALLGPGMEWLMGGFWRESRAYARPSR